MASIEKKVKVLGGTIPAGKWFLNISDDDANPLPFWSDARKRWAASPVRIGFVQDAFHPQLVLIDEKSTIVVRDQRAASGAVMLGAAGLLVGGPTKKSKIILEVSADGEQFLVEVDHDVYSTLQGKLFTLTTSQRRRPDPEDFSDRADPEKTSFGPRSIAALIWCVTALVAAVVAFTGREATSRPVPTPAVASINAPEPKLSLVFDDEADRFTVALKCPDHKFMHSMVKYGQGVLYGCTMGDGQAKFFINESVKRPGKVSDIKVMWNNYERDLGYGIHTGRDDAVLMVRAFAKLHAPHLEASLAQAFLETEEKTFATDTFAIEYKWTKGFGLNEHLLVATPR